MGTSGARIAVRAHDRATLPERPQAFPAARALPSVTVQRVQHIPDPPARSAGNRRAEESVVSGIEFGLGERQASSLGRGLSASPSRGSNITTAVAGFSVGESMSSSRRLGSYREPHNRAKGNIESDVESCTASSLMGLQSGSIGSARVRPKMAPFLAAPNTFCMSASAWQE